MIRTPTLFILGAGASKPFYPTGIELRQEIRRGDLRNLIIKALSHDKLTQSEYSILHDKFVKHFSGSKTYSIDFFLENRQDYMNIGKIAISTYLMNHERDGSLNESKDNWYMYLFDRIKSLSFDDICKNEIFFITFNYDRSLEHFLFEAIHNCYNEQDEKCASIISRIPIVHLYGQIDFLPWQKKDGKTYAYGSRIGDIERVRNSVTNIKLLSKKEDVTQSHEFQEAYKLICKAKKIYFLGFSFDETNLARLRIELMNKHVIHATVLDLGPMRKTWVENEFIKNGGTVHLHDLDCLSLLKETLSIE